MTALFDLESYIATEFGRRIGNKEEEAFIIGDGSSKPTGILDQRREAVNLEKQRLELASISFDDIMDLFYSLKISIS